MFKWVSATSAVATSFIFWGAGAAVGVGVAAGFGDAAGVGDGAGVAAGFGDAAGVGDGAGDGAGLLAQATTERRTATISPRIMSPFPFCRRKFIVVPPCSHQFSLLSHLSEPTSPSK